MTTKIQCNVLTPDLPSIQTHYKIKKFIGAMAFVSVSLRTALIGKIISLEEAPQVLPEMDKYAQPSVTVVSFDIE